MNRRWFLGAILAAGAAPAIVRAASLMPVRNLALPTTGEVLAVAGVGGNQLLTIEMITRETLRMFEKHTAFTKAINRQFEHFEPAATIQVRMPKQYRL